MISDILDLKILKEEYQNNEGFLKKIKWVETKFPHFRRVRRDGSCFYRAFLYTLFE